MGWHAARLAKAPPPKPRYGSPTGAVIPIGLTGGGGPVAPRVARSEPPGGGLANSLAVAGRLLESTLAGAGWNTSTTGHARSRYTGSTSRSPQQFIALTTQGSPQSKVNIEQTVETIRLSRRSLSRNRGRLEP